MLLIIFLSLIAKLTSVASDCDVGTQKVKNFDWIKVGINVLTGFLKQAAFKSAGCVGVLYFICGSINELSLEHIRLYFRIIE
jgi:hypothetical protein